MDTLLTLYPSPPAMLEKLTQDLPWSQADSFLEPSAGKGDICDFIKDKVRHMDLDLDAIEISPELQHILTGKEYRLIHDDFLTFETYRPYDYIIANFPFDEGDKHLDKALRLLERNGGGLRCVVNAETLRNPCTKLRQALVTKLKQVGAEIECQGGEFKSAERQTSVEIAMIRADVERPSPVSLILEHLEKAPKWRKTAEDFEPSHLVANDFINAICAVFDQECAGGVKLIEEFYAMAPYVQERHHKPGESKNLTPLIKLEVNGKNAGGSIADDILNFLRLVRKKYWKVLIDDDRFSYQYTSNILKELGEKLNELREYDFTPFNIRKLHTELQSKVVAGVEAAIMDLFETLTSKYAYGDNFGTNVHYFNGWKTNKAHYINHRVILPLRLMSYYTPGSFDWDAHKTISDMVKALNYLSKDKVDAPQLVSGAMEEAKADRRRYFSRELRLDLKYFSMRVFKGGTVHITFKDRDLLKKFNIFGCQKKKWLPPDYGKKRYKNLTPEEKAVVDSFHSFEGKEGYNRVVKNRSFFLVESQALAPVGFGSLTPAPPPGPKPPLSPLPESIGDDGMIAVRELAEPDPQMPLPLAFEDDENEAGDNARAERRTITRAE
jgi:hypothetical protein